MGYLKSIEDPSSGAVLKTFPRRVDTGDTGWQYRNATATIAGLQYGSSPFAGGIKPLAPRKWSWSVRELTRLRGKTEESVKDEYARAIRSGMEVRLVYITDDGYERIVTATADAVTFPHAPTAYDYVDVKIDFELLEHWHERGEARSGAVRMDQLPTIHMDQTPTVRMDASAAVQVVSISLAGFYAYPATFTDASLPGAGGIPSQPDTGPILEFHGPMGGTLGFAVSNPVVPGGAVLRFSRPLLAAEMLIMDTGAKQYRVGSQDVSYYVVVGQGDGKQPWDFCIWPGASNQLGLYWFGTLSVLPTAQSTMNVRWNRYYL